MRTVEKQRKKLYDALEHERLNGSPGSPSPKVLNESQKLDKLILIEQRRLLKDGRKS
ncbi:MAG: hypothetical protein BWY74_00045 [Firmicutes bacterium ADurb.Bin419]|nr:MAG: hypothetical protein BWY74_00045 [Firmicutes bacterium ADurb.Bin419]